MTGRRLVAFLALLGILGVLAAIGATMSLGSSGSCTNNGCKTTSTTETVKQAGNSGGFTQDSSTVQQNSFNSPKPNKQTTTTGPCTNPGGQTNCPHQ
ncbi:MAG: hypothetical protein JWO17_254 [Actinomycetia bacterium]|nr:hypothetical protein [Actinomycetes bacterium]